MIQLIALLLSCAAWPIASAPGELRIHFFDVGQGDSVLIQGPFGHNVLYDGGTSPAVLMAYLAENQVSRLDVVIASHNHSDHIGGLPEAIRRFRPRFYMDNGLPTSTVAYERVIASATESNVQLIEPHNRVIRMGSAVIDVLPPSGASEWGQNENAIGLIARIGRFRISMGGDAERQQWSWWLEHFRELLSPVQVHKASHHGSTNGDIRDAIEVLSPKAVIISAGLNNSYGHPVAETLRLYEDVGAKIYRTDLNGSIVVTANATGAFTIRAKRQPGSDRSGQAGTEHFQAPPCFVASVTR